MQSAGGLLFPCQSCSLSFCEDCLPNEENGFRILDTCDRFIELGFNSNHLCYIHCSEKCEEWAKKEFKWSLPSTKRAPTPTALDLSHAFGSQIDAAINTEVPEEICQTRLRKRKAVNYAELNITDHSMTQVPRQRLSKKKVDDDPEFFMDETKEVHQNAAEETKDPPKKRPAYYSKIEQQCEAHAALHLPSGDEYEVCFPITTNGYLFEVKNKANSTVFTKYLPTAAGQRTY